jgi:hypothetical protein
MGACTHRLAKITFSNPFSIAVFNENLQLQSYNPTVISSQEQISIFFFSFYQQQKRNIKKGRCLQHRPF